MNSAEVEVRQGTTDNDVELSQDGAESPLSSTGAKKLLPNSLLSPPVTDFSIAALMGAAPKREEIEAKIEGPSKPESDTCLVIKKYKLNFEAVVGSSTRPRDLKSV